MRIAIDLREACRTQRTGKGQWARGFVCELLRRGVRVQGFVDESAADDLPASDALELVRIPQNGLRWHMQVASLLRRTEKSVVYVSPTSYIVPVLVGRRMPVIPIVHDLIAFRGEPHETKATLIERLTLKRAVKSARFVCTISETTKKDLLHRCPFLDQGKIIPIFAGPLRAQVPLSNADNRTILSIGTLSPRKNQLRLIQAYASLPHELRDTFRLVLAGGRGWNDEAIVALASRTPGVVWKGYISAEEYDALLAMCTVFALPSLYEGFGLQILDALQRGIALLLADRGSLREVGGQAALYVDPEDVRSISTGLEHLLREETLRTQLSNLAQRQAKKFSWERTVDLFLEAIESVA